MAVAATAASKPAIAVLVASVADSGSVRAPPSRVGFALTDDPPVGEAVTSGLSVGFSVGVVLLVGLDSLVALADGIPVFEGVGVVEGPSVGLDPIVGVTVGVAEGIGAIVDVEVAIGVLLAALVGMKVEVATGVSEGALVGVFVAGGESTVKEPLLNMTPIPLPLGSVAAALLSIRDEVPGVAPTSTLKITLATVPFGIAS